MKTDVNAMMNDQIRRAENTAHTVLLHNYGVRFGKQLDSIVGMQIVLGTQRLWDNDTTEFINFAQKSCGLHMLRPFVVVYVKILPNKGNFVKINISVRINMINADLLRGRICHTFSA